MDWLWVLCSGVTNGVLCAEQDEGVCAAENCMCNTEICDHSLRYVWLVLAHVSY